MSFISKIKSITRTINENKANIVEFATHLGTAGYMIHQAYTNPNEETKKTCLVYVAGAVIGGIHGATVNPIGVLHVGPDNKGFYEEGSRFDKAGTGMLRGGTAAVLAYKAAGITSQYLANAGEFIGDVATETADMIA